MGFKNSIKKVMKKVIAISKEEKVVPILKPVSESQILDGKIALITGGSSGIGLSIAKCIISKGGKVIIAGTNQEKLKYALEKIGKEAAKAVVIDVTDIASLPEKIRQASSLYDENVIDILINSAGRIAKSDFLNMTEKEYDNVIDTNMKGSYFICQAMAKYMIENKIKGHILNISSASALRPAWSPYQMSKWAIKGMTLGLAEQLLPYGIIVNAIAPGPVATPMLGKSEGDTIYHPTNPSRRYAMPDEIAELATFMVSDMGNMIVGDTFYITGGGGTIDLQN